MSFSFARRSIATGVDILVRGTGRHAFTLSEVRGSWPHLKLDPDTRARLMRAADGLAVEPLRARRKAPGNPHQRSTATNLSKIRRTLIKHDSAWLAARRSSVPAASARMSKIQWHSLRKHDLQTISTGGRVCHSEFSSQVRTTTLRKIHCHGTQGLRSRPAFTLATAF
jgi:hypothetical protein